MFDGVQLPTKVPVGARLLGFAQEWDWLTTDSFVTSIVREGYQIELLSRPPLSTDPIPMPWPRNSHKAQTLRSEIRSLFPTTVTRVLQPHLLGAQEVWRLQTGVQFEAPEQVCRQGEVQNEDTTGYNHSIACRGLGSAHRSHRCLLSCSNSSQVKASTEVRPTDGGQSQGVSVPSSAIRPNIGTPGFYQGDIASDKICPFTWPALDSVSGRLDPETSGQGQADTRNRLVEGGHLQSGVGGQRGKIPVCTHTTICSHRHRISFGRGRNLPPMDRILKIENSIRQLQTVRVTTARFWLSLLTLLNSAVDATPLGRLHLRPLQIYLLAHWAPTSKYLKALIPVKLDLLHDHLAWWQNRSFTRAGMFLDLPDPQTHVFTDASTTGWGAHLETVYTMGTWTVPEAKCHINLLELLAVKYALLAFQTSLQKKICSTDVEQCHGCGLSAQSRGDKIQPLISRQQRDSPLRSPPAYGPTSQTHSRREEFISRPAISQGQSNSHKVDTQAVSSGCHLWGMGETQPRSVCYMAEQQASGLGVSHGRPSSSGSGCSVDVMERDVHLCFPSVCDIGESARKGAQRSPVRIDTGSPQMAQSVLVCQTVGSARRLSFAPAAEGRPPVSISQQTETPVPTSGVSTRLEAVQRSLQERGFSQAASAQISRGLRQSSRVVYDSKWRLVSGWCEEQEVNPFEVTVPQLADFFIYLFNVKQLNPRTIKGYRSAISATVSAYGSRREFSVSPELSALLRSFMLERPPQRKILPFP